ncbi:MAG: aminotransferase class IV [Crocinitomicaceae bacterium]|nr:aminotransferase class IV [Crocinitomicaceae bacterium]
MFNAYVNNNGKITSYNTPSILSGNRGHLFGDGLFESIRIINGKPVNLKNHISRLMDGAKALKIERPNHFGNDFFETEIKTLIKKSNLTDGGKCRLSIDRSAGGTFLPAVNSCTYHIEIQNLSENYFELNPVGLKLDVYQDIKIHKNFLSSYKTKNCLAYVMAALNAKEKNLDDVFMTNEKRQIIESSNSNLFIVHNGVLYTPSLEDGCLAGTMRMQIINLALENKIKVYECNIMPQNLLSAEEVFLTNAIKGLQWVGSFRSKNYSNAMARKFVVLLNEYWQKRTLSEKKKIIK